MIGSREGQAQIAREKEKNEDQEWWKQYYQRPHHHERTNSQDSMSSTSSGSSSPADADCRSPKYDYRHDILSYFPSPPHSNQGVLNKPLPPTPRQKRASKSCRGRSQDRSRSLSEKEEQMGLEESVSPISLVRFHRGWRSDNDNSWSRLCSAGADMTIEKYGEMLDALDRASAPSIFENEGNEMGSGEKWRWL